MKSINSPTDFETALKAETAIIFIHFPWSKHSQLARQLVEQWERELSSQPGRPNFTIHLLEPDAHPDSWKWVAKNAALTGDSDNTGGTLLWLRQSTVVGGFHNVGQTGIKTLSRMTDECFLEGNRPGLSTPPPEIPPFDLELLHILCCPETHQKLQLAATPILEKLNQQIATGRMLNRAGRVLDEQITAGLVRADGKYLYPMRQNIPILLVDEGILLKG